MRNESVKTMTMCAIMAALMCILGPMSIPIGAVPISFTNLVIYLTVYLLGAKKGCISYLIYMLLGVVGLPVFSGYTGGIAKLAGPTGGYLVGFILLALISGMVHDLNLTVCIEGIETNEERLKMLNVSPDYYQGFFFGKPCPYEEFVKNFIA